MSLTAVPHQRTSIGYTAMEPQRCKQLYCIIRTASPRPQVGLTLRLDTSHTYWRIPGSMKDHERSGHGEDVALLLF